MIRLTMLTPYRRKDAPEMSGVGDSALNWYSRRLAIELTRNGVDVRVVGPRGGDSTAEPWTDDRITVYPAFRRGEPAAVPQAARAVLRTGDSLVHVQHELFAFGGLFNAMLLPAALCALRLRGRRVLTTIHGVIPLAEVSEEFVRANRIPGNAATARLLWRTLINFVANASDRVHVHEAFLRDLLVSEYGVSPHRIEVVPLGIEPEATRTATSTARAKIGIPEDAEVALFFGYLAAYKGIDYLLDELPAMLRSRPNLHVIIAGGIPARLEGIWDPRTAIEALGSDAKRVHLLGFVPDDETADVFSASDVLMLPYTIAMSASGPLAIGAGYGVPSVMSTAFRRLFPDANGMFELKAGGLTRSINDFFNNADFRAERTRFVSEFRAARSWPAVAARLCGIYRSLLARQ